MTLEQFIEMLKAIENNRSFSVGFDLQYSNEKKATLQNLVETHSARQLVVFFEKIEAASPPEYAI